MKGNITSLLLAAIIATGTNVAEARTTLQKMKTAPLSAQTSKKISDFRTNRHFDFGTIKKNLSAQRAAAAALLSEDFSKFTAGTEDAPDATAINDATTGDIPSSYTNTPGWAGVGIKQAGGTAFIDLYQYSDGEDTGFLSTPLMDLSVNGGATTVSFRARLLDSSTSSATLSVLNLTDGEQYANTSSQVALTSEWQKFKLSFSKGTADGFYQFYTDAGKWQLDDVVITPEGLAAPNPTGATNYTDGGTSFTANWEAVEGATSYLLSVAHPDAEGYAVYDFQDKEVTGTSFDVTGLPADQTYYYKVAAKNAEGQSAASSFVLVRPVIAAPKLKAPTNITEAGYTANWEAVADASGYVAYNLIQYKAPKAGAYSLLDTDFSGITEGSLDSPVDNQENFLDAVIDRSDWQVASTVFANGYLGLDNSFYSMYPSYFNPGTVLSPVFDLSLDKGKVTVTFTAFSDGKGTSPAIDFLLASADPATGELTPITSSVQSIAITDKAAEYTVTLEGGTASSLIYMSANSNYSSVIYLDKLKVSQNFQAGEVQNVPVQALMTEGATATSADFKFGKIVEGEKYGYKVQGYGVDRAENTYAGAYSEIQLVEAPQSGVEKAYAADAAKAFATTAGVKIVNPAGAAVSIYNAAGTVVYKANNGTAVSEVALPATGLYIVRIGNAVFKVIK